VNVCHDDTSFYWSEQKVQATVHGSRAPSPFAVVMSSVNNNPGHVALMVHRTLRRVSGMQCDASDADEDVVLTNPRSVTANAVMAEPAEEEEKGDEVGAPHCVEPAPGSVAHLAADREAAPQGASTPRSVAFAWEGWRVDVQALPSVAARPDSLAKKDSSRLVVEMSQHAAEALSLVEGEDDVGHQLLVRDMAAAGF